MDKKDKERLREVSKKANGASGTKKEQRETGEDTANLGRIQRNQ